MRKKSKTPPFVDWFRQSSPYIHAHRGRTFVILFGGEAIADAGFAHIVHDLALLNSLGVRLILVHGARPQIEQRLKQRGAGIRYERGLRITDDTALDCVKEAAGTLRVEIEARLSMGLANTPMSGARIRVVSGNFITARPTGVHHGIDYGLTGEVRRVDTEAISRQLDAGDIVLLSPLGYSPTGEVFNISAGEVATSVAVNMKADKLMFLSEERGLLDSKRRLVRQLTPSQVSGVLNARRRLPDETRTHLQNALLACRGGVKRVHIIDRRADGALLQELFSRDGIGTLITTEHYEDMRPAGIDDVGGILELIEPLEQQGTLVRRSRERLETEIEYFTVAERDGMVIGCAALYPYPDEGLGELACLAVHPDYRNQGRGDILLTQLEAEACAQGLNTLFVLTTHTPHWFRERGFTAGQIRSLPLGRQALYNYRRNSKIFYKTL